MRKKQSLFIQNLLLQGSQPPLMVLDRDTKGGREGELQSGKNKELQVCPEWRLLAWKAAGGVIRGGHSV